MHGVGQAHALAVGQLAADLDPGHDARSRLDFGRPRAAPCRRRSAADGRARARRGFPDAEDARAWRRRASVSSSSTKRRACSSCTPPPSNVPSRSFGPCRSTRMPIGRPWRSSMRADRLTSSRMRVCGVWLMLMRKTSAPAMNSRSIMAGSDEAGPSVATILVRRWRLIVSSRRRSGPSLCRLLQCRDRTAAFAPAAEGRGTVWPFSVSCSVQFFCSMVSTSKKPVRSIAARQAVLDAADGEFSLARAHESLAGPFAALVVVHRVDVIEARDQRPADQRLAGIGAGCSTSLRWSSASCPCSRPRCRPGSGCGCTGGNRRTPAAGHSSASANKRAPQVPRPVDDRSEAGSTSRPRCGEAAAKAPFPLRPASGVNEHRPEVVDIGAGRARCAAGRRAARRTRWNCCRRGTGQDRGRARGRGAACSSRRRRRPGRSAAPPPPSVPSVSAASARYALARPRARRRAPAHIPGSGRRGRGL